MKRRRPTIVVFMGMVATGKSSLARVVSNKLACLHLNSDVIRKEITGTPVGGSRMESVDSGIYSSAVTEKTYLEIITRANAELISSESDWLIVDASYLVKSERVRLCSSFKQNYRFFFFHCVVSENVLKRRLEQRANDESEISDGNWEVYLEQKKRFEYPDELSKDQLVTLNTDMPLPVLLNYCLERLEHGMH